jgi:hypothetical protein
MNAPKTETIKLWNDLDKQLVRAGELVLEGLQHPDATPEMIIELTSTYRNIAADIEKTRAALRERYPDTGTWTGRYAWNHRRTS